jgi:phage shock protein PspC (stress-responsive transcriptional regulator)
MHKVVTINLNGQAYQFDEDAYEAIRGYLDRAEAQLRDNPDRAEILADLEQAIGDKCRRYLTAHKTVIASREIMQVLEEMGPVESTSTTSQDQPAGPASTPGDRPRAESAPRRLYRIDDGAMIGGVCNGIAAFFGIDVALMRVAFAVVAAIELAASHVGIMLIAYVVMMLVVPMAGTAQPRTIQRSRVASSPAQLAASAASLDAPDAVSVAMAIMAACAAIGRLRDAGRRASDDVGSRGGESLPLPGVPVWADRAAGNRRHPHVARARKHLGKCSRRDRSGPLVACLG